MDNRRRKVKIMAGMSGYGTCECCPAKARYAMCRCRETYDNGRAAPLPLPHQHRFCVPCVLALMDLPDADGSSPVPPADLFPRCPDEMTDAERVLVALRREPVAGG